MNNKNDKFRISESTNMLPTLLPLLETLSKKERKWRIVIHERFISTYYEAHMLITPNQLKAPNN